MEAADGAGRGGDHQVLGGDLGGGEEEEEEEREEGSSPRDGALAEPRRRVFVVDLGGKGRAESEAHPKFDGKLSLEVVTAGNPKAPQISGVPPQSRGAGAAGTPKTSRHRGRREWGTPGDSEIEEGEIVQPEEERFSPLRIFRASAAAGTPGSARSRAPEPRAPRLPEGGDDFLSLHADSDEEADFGAESQPDPRWKSGGSDLRRKILTQRRLRAPPSPRSPSAASRKKSKRSRERGGSGSAWGSAKKPPEPAPKSKERHRRRGSRSRSRRRSWSRRSRSREKRRSRRSGSSGRSRHKEKHRGDKKKKKQRSRSRERRGSRRDAEPKAEKGDSGSGRRRELRAVVPPSVQELNDSDLFAIKRTITVSRRAATPEPKREVLYDSEGLSFEGFSDREHAEFPARKAEARPPPPPPDKKDKERKRGRTEERPPGREKYKKKFKEYPEPAAPDAGKSKEKQREKAARKGKTGGGHKEAEGAPPKPPASRKVKLQSKVSVLIREGVSSTTTPGKEGGGGGAGPGGGGAGPGGGGPGSGIAVKFARDAESRAPFLKAEEKADKGGPKAEGPARDGGAKPRKLKPPKAKGGVKKVKVKAKGEARKKRKTKTKGALKKSKADSCSQGAGTPPLRLPPKPEPAWSGSEKSGGATPKPPSPPPTPAAPKAPPAAAAPAAPPERELTPDSQTVDSSCKTPDVSFLPEEGTGAAPQGAGTEGGPGGGGDAPPGDPEADSRSEGKEEPARPPGAPPAAAAAAGGWSLQGGVDCATSGVLALTALLFKMEEANLASRAKAQELIQATNQILSHTKAAPPPPCTEEARPEVTGGTARAEGTATST